jgi:Fe2+ or Zn2+ uptake regulation protein
MSPDSHFSRSLIEEFSARGLRMTPQRRALLEIIQVSRGHLNAATLLQKARETDADIDRATVYRTLDLLRKLRLGGPRSDEFGEVRSGTDQIRLACFECGKIEEFGSPLFEQLKQEIGHDRGFNVNVVRLEAGGRCRSCTEREKLRPHE